MRNANGHAKRDTHRYPHRDAYAGTNGDRDQDHNANRDSHGDCDFNGNGDDDGYFDCDGYSNGDSLRDAYCHAHTRRIVDFASEFEIPASETRHQESSQDFESDQRRRGNGEIYRNAGYR